MCSRKTISSISFVRLVFCSTSFILSSIRFTLAYIANGLAIKAIVKIIITIANSSITLPLLLSLNLYAFVQTMPDGSLRAYGQSRSHAFRPPSHRPSSRNGLQSSHYKWHPIRLPPGSEHKVCIQWGFHLLSINSRLRNLCQDQILAFLLQHRCLPSSFSLPPGLIQTRSQSY